MIKIKSVILQILQNENIKNAILELVKLIASKNSRVNNLLNKYYQYNDKGDAFTSFISMYKRILIVGGLILLILFLCLICCSVLIIFNLLLMTTRSYNTSNHQIIAKYINIQDKS